MRSELAPLRAERRNHRSSTAGLQGPVRSSSCWAHSGTRGEAGSGAKRWGEAWARSWRIQPRPSPGHTERHPEPHSFVCTTSSHSLCVCLKPTLKMSEHRLPRCSSDTPDTRSSQCLGFAVASIGNVLSLSIASFAQISLFQACLKLHPSPPPNTPHSFLWCLLL